MNTSKEDALGLLRKLEDERASVILTILSSFCKLNITGIVSECTTAALWVTSPDPDEKSCVYIDLSQSRDFDYSDSREAPSEVPERAKDAVAAVLYFQLPQGVTVAIFELITKTSAADEA